MRERIAEEAGDAHGHVDARAAQFLGRDHLQARDPAGGLIPLGADALLEEMVVGLERKVGCGGDVVLCAMSALPVVADIGT